MVDEGGGDDVTGGGEAEVVDRGEVDRVAHSVGGELGFGEVKKRGGHAGGVN